ncbi:hypothetical protein A8F94_04550 [Bacillus sp. FJAT-27225]|uniref:VrrA/YqfQ family protein n=1 Tax=Bacillus sp. FJAT-27225 TaxID=1743144 RepID=UPI00080C2CEC|nr:VrrA/YqfQ family protein [Bacillus sp. FJAT-27225]OCA91134.1 hypothetical protein A8F94_04550 [Bacillus sp. FJAT-27225]
MPPFPPMYRQGGMNRPAMGPGRHPFGRSNGFNGPPSPFMGPMPPRSQGQRGGGGGLLSRLLGKSGRGQVPGREVASRAGDAGQSGSILNTLSNPESLNAFLANTQNVIQTVQSFSPLIEQYGPIVKNLPSMWKLYRGLKNTDTEETSEKKPVSHNKSVKTKSHREDEEPKDTKHIEESSDGHSSSPQRDPWLGRPIRNEDNRVQSNRNDDDRPRPRLFF